MAVETLPPEHLKAGEEYLAALKHLGLSPEFLGWGQNLHSRKWMLIMVTSAIEIGGPLALEELLFRAFNMKATPQQISPFIVRVYGPRTLMAPELRSLGYLKKNAVKAQVLHRENKTPVGEPLKIESMGRDLADFHIESRDVYVYEPTQQASHERRVREWSRFKQNVERLAA